MDKQDMELANKLNSDLTMAIESGSAMAGKLCLDLPTSLIPQQMPEHLLNAHHIAQLPLETQAIISNLQTTLSTVLQWQVGTQLTLGNAEDISADLTIADKKVATVTLKTDTQIRQVSVEDV